MSTTMTHQHFQLIADVLADAIYDADTLAVEYPASIGWEHHRHELRDLAHEFADRLEETNPNLDRDRFLTAAGASA